MPADLLPLTGDQLAEPLDPTRAGMPSLDTVHQVISHTPEPGGPTYTILRSTEFDPYESSPATAAVAHLLQQGQPVQSEAIAAALAAARPPTGDNFGGTARKASKLSIGTGAVQQYTDIAALVASLPADSSMIHHKPPIPTGPTSTRVTEEQRNVHITAFLYAASHEADNDFHLIIGRDPSQTPETYMTMEVSGLPPARMPSFQKIKAARDSFKAFFGPHLPLLSYDFYHPPIPVVIEGSLFFDMDHAVGPHPGPPSLKSRMPTVWEVHPVTSITLGRH